MTNNDLISDMLTRIRNAILVKANKVEVLRSNLNLGIAKILKDEGFIESFKESGKSYCIEEDLNVNKFITITLKYKGPTRVPCIKHLKRISRPGLRIYVGYKRMQKIFGGTGFIVLSTPKGLMTCKNAKLNKLGGEALFSIW